MSQVHAMPVMLGVLAVLAVAYRFYSAFLAARVAVLDDTRTTPAHLLNDGQNYHPTNRWVLFGHHFAAISGAGPLIGPVLAIQFGYMPGLVWLVVGVCLAGAVQDMMTLAASVRLGGKSLAGLARAEVGPVAGAATTLAILYVIVIALAGLGIVVVKALGGEEVAMKAGTSLTPPASVQLALATGPDGKQYLDVPPETTYKFGDAPDQTMVFHEPFRMMVPDSKAPQPSAPDSPTLVLPDGAKRLVPGSSWGTFTIACTVPIALAVGWYMYRFRKGKVVEASLMGAIAVLAATVVGAWIPGSSLERYFIWDRNQTTAAIAGYGFVASILPVWLLLCPRDYLSSFLKIGTIGLLVIGVLVANPVLEAPAINHQFSQGGGPYFDGPIFPYVFICVMCGAISGFHALVSSGTTPKMVDRESDVRMIGYGAMLMEGLVGVVALIAAAALPNSMYYDINIDLARRPQFQQALKALDVDHDGGELVQMEADVQESLHGRTGGAVTLAVGMARIFSQAMPGFNGLIKYWYHFAIMFEALFILTTIDTGTRIGRFLLQEVLGKIWKPLGDLDRLGPSILATGLIVVGWGTFIATGSVETIWPMFGMANQLLSVIALAIATTILVNAGRARYSWVTLLPLLFVATTTTTAGYYEITGKFRKMTLVPATALKGYLNIGLTVMLLACVAVILVSAASKCLLANKAAQATGG
ncbi:carbon starvation CstA family protein [Tundrisphaera sp. TA3]|uniref:carbon starvation CstA family protein n=1 Tax=Tundrisphaera sp. TA3 TaxID=3435775 RepID=UPI003EB6A488